MTESSRDENFERSIDEYLKKHNLVLSTDSKKLGNVNNLQRNYAKRREKNIGSEYKKMRERKGVMSMLADYINKEYIEDYENDFTKLKSSKNIEKNENNKKMDMPAKKGRKKKEVIKPVTDSTVPLVNKPLKKGRKKKVKEELKKEEVYIPSAPIDIPKEVKKEDPQPVIPGKKTAAEEKKEKAQERKRLAAERKKKKEERKKSRTPEQQKKIDERMAKMRAKRLANKK
jgi:hypothetical protein